MSTTLGSLCKKNLVNQWISFKDVVCFKCGYKENSEFRTLLKAADFAKMDDFKHYELHKAVEHK